ncbi:hypothetical protein [Ruegeria arenilitoris]|uniref:hypothetical protein n=1 Tax=Ruegeria arenilitoris TaxID=1173585 RepID=UPI001CFCDA5E|nr:hypothetical protein [Ruegeria arenilitoris]
MAFDPALIATWKPKAASGSYRTYRVDAQGYYFIADPAAPFVFQSGGTKFKWGNSTYTKTLGNAGEIVGLWTGDTDGEEWNFRADGTVTVHFSATDEYFGNYELRSGDMLLWYEEFRSVVSTVSQRIVFDPPYASNQDYNYTVDVQYWTLLAIATGTPVFEYEKV